MWKQRNFPYNLEFVGTSTNKDPRCLSTFSWWVPDAKFIQIPHVYPDLVVRHPRFFCRGFNSHVFPQIFHNWDWSAYFCSFFAIHFSPMSKVTPLIDSIGGVLGWSNSFMWISTLEPFRRTFVTCTWSTQTPSTRGVISKRWCSKKTTLAKFCW